MTISKMFLFMMIYSFVGWAYESILCSIVGKKFINRGFLNGPVCPIYGVGGLMAILIFGNPNINVFVLFFSSAILASVLEYFTSWAMEKIFKARWWDYSTYEYNINGRVSLYGAIVFGILSVLVVKYVHPFISVHIEKYLSDYQINWISGGLFIIFVLDLVFTVHHVLKLNGRLEKVQQAYNRYKDEFELRKDEMSSMLRERFENSEFYSKSIENILSIRKFQDKRLINAFPKLSSSKYKEAWERLIEKLSFNKD